MQNRNEIEREKKEQGDNEIIFFENDSVTITYRQSQKLGVASWRGFIRGNEFQELTLACLEMINKFGLTLWLADNRKMKAIRQQDQQWVVETLVPKLLESPLSKMATLVSDDLFNKMAVDQMIQRASPLPGLLTRDFNSKKEALQWLLEPDKQD